MGRDQDSREGHSHLAFVNTYQLGEPWWRIDGIDVDELTFYKRLSRELQALYAPMVALLEETRRKHDRGYNDESCDYPPCPRHRDEYDVGPSDADKCTCGADAWNARIDEVLNETR